MPIDIIGVARYRMPKRTIAVSAVEKLPSNCRSKSSADFCTRLAKEIFEYIQTATPESRLYLHRQQKMQLQL